MPELTGTKDLRSYFSTFWRWKWLFLVFLVAAPVLAYVVERGKPAQYSATTLVGVNATTVNSSLANTSGSFSTTNIVAIAQLVTTTPVADIAAGLLKPPGNPGAIAGETSATGDPATSFLRITSTDSSPARAAEIANAFAKAISLDLQRSSIAQIDASIRTIQKQLARLKPTDGATRLSLQQELQQQITSKSTSGGQAAILQAASPGSAAATGTNLHKTVELGLLIGLLLGFGAIVMAENADRRLRNPDDLEGLTHLPLLAAIESSAFTAELSSGREDDESFQMLRTALMYFNVERQIESVVITSAGEKEGKTTVATRLSLSAASAGLDVILVDADLRRAQVSVRLGLQNAEGLGGVLAGTREPLQALVDRPLETAAAGRLRVLPAGPPPPNPSALMSSERMQKVLHTLESASDLVIVDTPAALAVSDPLPLMRSVTGVVVIARMNQSTRQSIRRLQNIIESAHGNLLGVVATGVTVGPGYGHYYPKYYASNGNGGNGAGHKERRLRGRKGAKATAEARDE